MLQLLHNRNYEFSNIKITNRMNEKTAEPRRKIKDEKNYKEQNGETPLKRIIAIEERLEVITVYKCRSKRKLLQQ